MVDHEPHRKLAVLLHADVVDSTNLVRRNDTVAHQRIRDVFQRFSETIVAHMGIAHEFRGDALVAEFNKGSDAVSASVAFQNANKDYNKSLNGDIRPEIRIGIAMGAVCGFWRHLSPGCRLPDSTQTVAVCLQEPG